MEETAARSRELAARTTMQKNIAYGPTVRRRMDIVFPSSPVAGAPLHMFIHGGYWRAGSKDAHTLVAAPVIAVGGIAAIVTYELMPQTRLGAIVGQIRQAACFLQRLAPDLGADLNRFTVSGHSAGALAQTQTTLRADRIRVAVPLSIFDLDVQDSFRT
ncbi:MAG: hypothetical protein COB16_18235 [Rhodobacteraceae bacterium]|nr:MAG: hypothetical protein COB16_18235 [Paracoccaceae bacterium]